MNECTNRWLMVKHCCCCSATKPCPTLCDPMDCSTPGFSVLHDLLEFAQAHVHWISDAIQPSHPVSPSSPPALNLYQHQGLFQWVGSSYQVAKVLELQFQHQSFQCLNIQMNKWRRRCEKIDERQDGRLKRQRWEDIQTHGWMDGWWKDKNGSMVRFVTSHALGLGMGNKTALHNWCLLRGLPFWSVSWVSLIRLGKHLLSILISSFLASLWIDQPFSQKSPPNSEDREVTAGAGVLSQVALMLLLLPRLSLEPRKIAGERDSTGWTRR